MVGGAIDTLGKSGVFHDPLWRVTVTLSALEQELLRCWWVRRLGFISHAGAAAMVTTQSYSRLEHSLGLLALVAHFDPEDRAARAAALLHDVGHLPFSHTFEGVAGLNHHHLGVERVMELDPVLRHHGLGAAGVLAVERGERPSVLRGAAGLLRLDHLESFVRSARAHGRTRQPPPDTLSRLRIVDGVVDTDAETGAYLVDLVLGEARSQSSTANIVATGVMRHLATRLLTGMPEARRAEVAAMTDDEFWGLLLTHPRTAPTAHAFRSDPAAWDLVPDPIEPLSEDSSLTELDDIEYVLLRRYVDLPLVDGLTPPPHPSAWTGLLPPLPWRCSIRRRDVEHHF